MHKLTIFETEPSGHHLILHVRHIMREALSRGWQVRLATSERATKDRAFHILREDFGDRFEVSIVRDIRNEETTADGRKVLEHFQRWRAYRDAYRALPEKPDVVYSVSLEKLDLPMSVLGSPFGRTPFCGLLLVRYFHCPEMGIKTEPLRPRERLMEPVFWRLLRIKYLKTLLTLDPKLAEFAAKKKRVGGEKVRYLPDIASFAVLTPVDDAKGKLGIPADRFVVLNFGAMTPRKGLQELVEALDHPDCPERVVGLFAGRQDIAAAELMSAPRVQGLREQERLFEINRFLDSEEENLVFQAADAVWVGYRRFYGMSGVLVQSAAAGRPVLANDEGLISHLVESYGLGLIADIDDHAAVANALSRLASDQEFVAECGRRGSSFAEDHTPTLFGKRVCDYIAAAAERSSF